MNRLLSLGPFTLILSVFSGHLLAGDAALCEPLKQDQNKSLYGLCLGWLFVVPPSETKGRLLCSF